MLPKSRSNRRVLKEVELGCGENTLTLEFWTKSIPVYNQILPAVHLQAFSQLIEREIHNEI